MAQDNALLWAEKMPSVIDAVQNGTSEEQVLAIAALTELAGKADKLFYPKGFACEFKVFDQDGNHKDAFFGDMQSMEEAETLFRNTFPADEVQTGVQVLNPRIVGIITNINGYPTNPQFYQPDDEPSGNSSIKIN